VRRVARFDMELVLDACRVNRPTHLVVHGLDYLDYKNLGVTEFSDLTENAKIFLHMIRNATGVPLKYAFTGKPNTCVVDLEKNRDFGNLIQNHTRLQYKEIEQLVH
jgi:adenylosuccinate synthase